MKIFDETKKLAEREKFYTAKLLKNLMIIEKDKLYSDLKYPSLHKYIVKELNYSDAQATVRVNATRLMLKSKLAEKLIVEDKLSLTSANGTKQSGRPPKESFPTVLHTQKVKTLTRKLLLK